jgi:hypothetical protein
MNVNIIINLNILDLGIVKQTINTPAIVTKIVYTTKTKISIIYIFLPGLNRFLININMNSIDNINEYQKWIL